MVEIISLIVLIVSLALVAAIIARKTPQLLQLPASGVISRPAGFWEGWRMNALIVAKRVPFLRNFSRQAFMTKILSKSRVLTLKTENKISTHLEKLREQNKIAARAKTLGDNYWGDIKTLIKTKDMKRGRHSTSPILSKGQESTGIIGEKSGDITKQIILEVQEVAKAPKRIFKRNPKKPSNEISW